MKLFLQFCVFLFALLFPLLVLADMPMVLMYGIARYIFIPIALLVEFLVLKFFFELTWSRAAKASITVNVITYLIGILAFPLLGILVYGSSLIELIGQFIVQGSLAEYLLIMLAAAAIDSVIELAVLKAVFKCALDSRRILIWFAANLASAFIVLLGVGYEHSSKVLSGKRLDAEELSCAKQMHNEEIIFMRRAGQEASEHYENERFFDRQWIEEIEIESQSFTSFQIFGINSGERNLQHGFFVIDWDSSENHLGRFSEPGFEIEKSEVIQNGQVITVYKVMLTPPTGHDYEVYSILESNPDCLKE